MLNSNTKNSFVLIIGETNAGKSTLINQIIGAKVSIVSHKVQTTRVKVLAIDTFENTQIVFIDTPGIFNASRKFDEAMIKLSFSQIKEADQIILLIDANKGITKHTKDIIKKLPDTNNILVLNKIDLVNKQSLLELLNNFEDKEKFSKFFMISAIKNNGIVDLLSYLRENAKEGTWFFEEDQISDTPLQLLAAEVTREKIYKFLNQELPYNIIVKPLSWKEDDKKIIIHQDIYVTKESHKRILLGKAGEKIKQIRLAATSELEQELEKKINLFLYVKIDDKLFLREQTFKDIGLDFIS